MKIEEYLTILRHSVAPQRPGYPVYIGLPNDEILKRIEIIENMTPSQIHYHNELNELKESLKTAKDKVAVKYRIKEIEQILGLKDLEKASIATDEQPE